MKGRGGTGHAKGILVPKIRAFFAMMLYCCFLVVWERLNPVDDGKLRESTGTCMVRQ